jgi:hypothetical protein
LLALFSNCTWKRFGKIKLRARSSFLCGFYDTIGIGPLTDYLREVWPATQFVAFVTKSLSRPPTWLLGALVSRGSGLVSQLLMLQ